MKYKCWICEEEINTTDLFTTINFHIENGADDKDGGDIIEALQSEKICSWCALRTSWWIEDLRKIKLKQKEDSQFTSTNKEAKK